MRPVVKRKRPLLKPCHRKARMEFAERHQEWTIEDWKRVIWSDETKINHLGSDGRKNTNLLTFLISKMCATKPLQ